MGKESKRVCTFYCTTETNTTLLIDYIPIKCFFKKYECVNVSILNV